MGSIGQDGEWTREPVRTGDSLNRMQRFLTGGACGLRHGALAGVVSEVTVAVVAAFAIDGAYAPMLVFIIVGAAAGGILGLLLGLTSVTPTLATRSMFAALTAAPAVLYGVLFAFGIAIEPGL